MISQLLLAKHRFLVGEAPGCKYHVVSLLQRNSKDLCFMCSSYTSPSFFLGEAKHDYLQKNTCQYGKLMGFQRFECCTGGSPISIYLSNYLKTFIYFYLSIYLYLSISSYIFLYLPISIYIFISFYLPVYVLFKYY